MATNQRTGIIAKYAKNLGPLLQGLTGSGPGGAAGGAGSFGGLGSGPSGLSGVSGLSGMSGVSGTFGSFGSMPSFPGIPALGALASPASSGGYTLQVFFYFFLYGFVIFLLLLLIHYTVYPMFRFVPGGKGFIPVSTSTDYSQYWTKGTQPLLTNPAPDSTVLTDPLMSYHFDKMYSLSIDICLTDLTKVSGINRLIFYGSTNRFNPTSLTMTPNQSIPEQIASTSSASGVSMVCYVDPDTNNLLVTYFLKDGTDTLQRSSFPVQNIPLYTPFRITIVYDTNIFTVYYNGMKVSQTPLFGKSPRSLGSKHSFYANTSPNKCGYVQNLLLWNRPLLYTEITGLNVGLTPIKKFALPNTKPSGLPASCPTVNLGNLGM